MQQNGTATDGAPPDLSEDWRSHAPPGADGRSPNGHPDATDEADSLEADDTSVEGDIATSFFDTGAAASGLQVDPDARGQADGAHSLYAFSTYPRIQEAFQVEHPFDTVPDSATM